MELIQWAINITCDLQYETGILNSQEDAHSRQTCFYTHRLRSLSLLHCTEIDVWQVRLYQLRSNFSQMNQPNVL
jgi:hypothetical protein